MAAADYHLCAVCKGKAFYDANVDDERYLAAFWPVTGFNGKAVEPIGIGVLCAGCNKTHEIIVRKRENTP